MKVKRKRASAIVIHKNKVLGFHAEDPLNHREYVFLPGGVPEGSESLADAAKRETLEETGYTIRIKGHRDVIRIYDFEWNGTLVECETHYFVGELENLDAKPVNDASYNKGVVWVPVNEIKATFGYHKDILDPIMETVGTYLGTFEGMDYYSHRRLDPVDVIELYRDSGLQRPIEDQERIAEMYENSNLILSAWSEDQLVGVARSLTDFSYCCYLSDLAVAKRVQKKGIGKKLIELTKSIVGPRSNLLLLSAPGAMEYYPKIGFEVVQNGFILKRSE